VIGVDRRSLMLANCHDATLDDSRGCSLVPWKQVIEPRLGWRSARW